MFPVSQLFNAGRTITCKCGKLTPSHLWGFCSFPCHSAAEVVRKGAAKKQVIKKHTKERTPCQQVLDVFDQQYSQDLGDLWASARSLLLDPRSWQYGVMLNRFTAGTDVRQILQSQGFSMFLPPTEVSTRLSDASEKQTGKDSLMSTRGVSTCPPVDSHPQCDSTSHVLSQDLQSELFLTSPRPSLQCYIHPYPHRFPSQPHRPGQLKQYYLLNAASLLPVLALQVKDGEKVLDLCSAPGGKALAIMQCATPDLLCCNEPDPHRRNWLTKTLESFLPHSQHNKVIVSAQDGQCFGQSEAVTYDKVLVDAPCSNDRSWLYSSSSQQGEQRLKERAGLPTLQTRLLKSALSLVRPGGLVVYSTCTLSNSENYAVVETVLRDCPEAEPEDLWEEIAIPYSKHFAFGPAYPGHGQTSHHRLGILVVPQPGKTWGPMFLSRIRKRT
ncbi:tRNA (cytosine(34)-C(5))-methyltransferase, mitochondrial isoform X2 [Solea solea]|uniref:tRNA (cytosine(34)-C(5))-methyltransferase, mitochondrial isoform X1 n=1 Tax=Solea solea TaxID=90069 RepID=UPI00272A188D|nr:tRNA (cytosine(34)-C(5))-methyltransferase, mitochondrial isoform X1 [Solea solea]XP_058484616.1 tRNA (cytosine(34)-C(5))-methyltransferase, mitochondrial isoform X2 [Solea solea]